MMKVFIDTNIMVDVLLGRKEFLLQSSNIFQLADNEDVELYATALTFVNALYVSRKVLGKETALKKLKAFHDILKTAPMGDDELSKRRNMMKTMMMRIKIWKTICNIVPPSLQAVRS